MCHIIPWEYREGEREGGREKGREGGRKGGREKGRERGREGWTEEGEREGGREGVVINTALGFALCCTYLSTNSYNKSSSAIDAGHRQDSCEFVVEEGFSCSKELLFHC